MIVLLLSTPSNSRIVSSKNELSDVRSRSMDKREISASRWSVIVVLRCVFILVNAENDRSHYAVLTTMVSAILKILVSVGKAVCSCRS